MISTVVLSWIMILWQHYNRLCSCFEMQRHLRISVSSMFFEEAMERRRRLWQRMAVFHHSSFERAHSAWMNSKNCLDLHLTSRCFRIGRYTLIHNNSLGMWESGSIHLTNVFWLSPEQYEIFRDTMFCEITRVRYAKAYQAKACKRAVLRQWICKNLGERKVHSSLWRSKQISKPEPRQGLKSEKRNLPYWFQEERFEVKPNLPLGT